MPYHDHGPIILDKFNGLWQRGNADSAPTDHFLDCNNVRYFDSNTFATRYGIAPSQNVSGPITNVKRIYNYPTANSNDLIALTVDSSGVGHIYHITGSTTIYGPLLSIQGMTDFSFVPYAGRAYISPFSSLPPGFPAPATTVSVAAHAGIGIDLGNHQYAVTFANANGETAAAALVPFNSHAGIADPTVSPVYNPIPNYPFGSGLQDGGVYSVKVTYSTDNNLTETGGSSSATFTYHSGIGPIVSVTPTSGIPVINGLLINLYRTIAGGSIYYRDNLYPVLAVNFNSPGFTGFIVGYSYPDSTLVNQPQIPAANTTSSTQCQLSNIPIAPSIGGITITKRNIYRTKAGSSQLQLLTTINDNTTTTFLDSTPDASLGANYPINNSPIILPGNNVDKGLNNQYVYVYAGDGTAARLAAGVPISGTMSIAAGITGQTDAGLHVYGVVAETRSGYLSPPGALGTFTNIPTNTVSFGNIPTSGDPNVVKRHIVASAAIASGTYDGNPQNYTLYFIPNAVINNNTDTYINNVGFLDAQLLSDASHLFDNLTQIPAGAVMCMYHNRMLVAATFTDISLAYLSAIGEPEAMSQVSGEIIVPLDGNPITNAAELRDVLYITKRAKTVAYADNGQEPSFWPMMNVDSSLGSCVHGIATVLDSGATTVDFLIICTYQGVSLFNGRYITPELSWKIEAFWKAQSENAFNRIQILNAPIQKEIYVVLPDGRVLVGQYGNGLDFQKIRWAPWSWNMPISTVAIWNINQVLIGA